METNYNENWAYKNQPFKTSLEEWKQSTPLGIFSIADSFKTSLEEWKLKSK